MSAARATLAAETNKQLQRGERLNVPAQAFSYKMCAESVPMGNPYTFAVEAKYCLTVQAGEALLNFRFGGDGWNPTFALENERGSVEVDDKGVTTALYKNGIWPVQTDVGIEDGKLSLTYGGSASLNDTTTISYSVTPGVRTAFFVSGRLEAKESGVVPGFGGFESSFTLDVQVGNSKLASEEGEPVLINEKALELAAEGVGITAAGVVLLIFLAPEGA